MNLWGQQKLNPTSKLFALVTVNYLFVFEPYKYKIVDKYVFSEQGPNRIILRVKIQLSK